MSLFVLLFRVSASHNQMRKDENEMFRGRNDDYDDG